MRSKRSNVLVAVAAVGGLAYPALVYVSLPRVSPILLAGVGLALIAIRLWGMRGSRAAVAWVPALLLAAAVLGALALAAPALAVKAYPTLLSLAATGVFGASLIWPPSLVERMARIREPALSPAGQAYTRRVTQVWTVFLSGNTLVSAATALWGTAEQWMLWNGLIFYLLAGALFVGELAIRQYVRERP
jgi:uncharacterized membrane protein